MTAANARHILVIGAGAGLGVAVAQRFAQEGFSVTLLGRRAEKLEMLAEPLRLTGTTVHTVAADAADPETFRTALERVAAESNPGVVVYNAAELVLDNLLTDSDLHFARALQIDALAAITAARIFVPAMREGGSGTVLLTGGGLATSPSPTMASLSLGKVALRAIATMLHRELADTGIHVASISISGSIAANTPLAPDLIAEKYWNLHTQAPSLWRDEFVFDGS